jgi:hypothetical protein
MILIDLIVQHSLVVIGSHREVLAVRVAGYWARRFRIAVCIQDPSCMTSAHLLARTRAISGAADYHRGSEGGSDLVHQEVVGTS